MNHASRLGGIGLAVLVAAGLSTAPAAAASGGHPAASGRVFVQTDNLSGNSVVAYDRDSDGTLHQADVQATGGLGGALDGSVVDHLASQGSLAYDRSHHVLYAVNAGSDTVSVLGVDGDQLRVDQVVRSGGTFPVSVAVHGNLVYVLNARDGGSVRGFSRESGRLVPLAGSRRVLGLDAAATPEFTHTPGQVAFTPDGSQLLVTTKGNTSAVDVFAIDGSGRPSPEPTVNEEPGAVPFGLTFDHKGRVLVSEAGPNAVETFALSPDGTLTSRQSVATGQAATCWIVGAGDFFYASNAGSASVSGYVQAKDGSLDSLGNTGTDTGTVDAASTPDGRFVYVQTGGNGVVDEFRVNGDGSLTSVGSVTVPGALGGEGIVAS